MPCKISAADRKSILKLQAVLKRGGQYRNEVELKNKFISPLVSNITANIALKLSRYFSLSEFFWLNLQMRYDLEKDAVAQQLKTEIQKTSVLRRKFIQ